MKPGRGARRTGATDGGRPRWGEQRQKPSLTELPPQFRATPPLFSAAQLLCRPPSPSARAHPPALSLAAPPRPLLAAHPARVPAAAAATPLPPPPPPPPSQPRQPPQPPRFSLSRRRRKAPRLLPRGYTRQNGETETSWQI
nr:atherin-like [Pongo abelii]